MKTQIHLIFVMAALSLLIEGCVDRIGETYRSKAIAASGPPAAPPDLGSLIYLAAQTVAERAGVLAKDRPIIVTTIVGVNDLTKSSTFGRLASQLISNRLAQRGYLVRDVTYMRALYVQPETGELALSREASRIGATANAQAVVTGTYAVGGREIYLNIRMLKADDGGVLSSADVVIPLDDNITPMLN
jgi:TolB-like protein